jgi:DNA polymerase-1
MLIFDCETNGLLEDVSKVHCLVIRDTLNDKVFTYKDNIQEGCDLLMNTDQEIGGHNVIKYDVPVLSKLYNFKVLESKVVDTLVLSRLIYPDLGDIDAKLLAKNTLESKLYKSHSLKAWGQRLGHHKGEYDMTVAENRENWSQEMQDYCEQDTFVTAALYKFLMKKEPSVESVELEHKLQWIVAQMERDGFPFNEKAAFDLHNLLVSKKLELEVELTKAFPPWIVKEDKGISKVNNKKTGRVKGERYIKETLVEFNPNSRQHIADRLMTKYKWQPKEFTANGQPKVDDSVISELIYPEAKILAKYLVIQKRLGQLADGDQAWLKKVGSDGKIHGNYTTNGAVTSRATHSNPNIAQVPSSSAPYGSECRSLFTCSSESRAMVGADLSGLELRCLAHFMAQFDGGEYGRKLLDGDIHTENQKAAGLETRAQAKTFIYGFLYGAGAAKIGEIVGGTPKEGQALKNRFLSKVPALKRLISGVTNYAEKHGWVPGLDKRKLPIRSPHAALNTLLQSAGALISKQAIIIFKQLLIDKGYQDRTTLLAWIHDEIQIETDREIADEIGKLAVQSFEMAGEHFKFHCPITGEYKVGSNWAETH